MMVPFFAKGTLDLYTKFVIEEKAGHRKLRLPTNRQGYRRPSKAKNLQLVVEQVSNISGCLLSHILFFSLFKMYLYIAFRPRDNILLVCIILRYCSL